MAGLELEGADHVDERAQSSGNLPARDNRGKQSLDRRRPVLEHSDELPRSAGTVPCNASIMYAMPSPSTAAHAVKSGLLTITRPSTEIFCGATVPLKRPLEHRAIGTPAILHAAVTGEIVGDAGPRASSEVGRRANHGYFPERSHHSGGDHIGVRAVPAGSDTGVKSLRHNIDRRFASWSSEMNRLRVASIGSGARPVRSPPLPPYVVAWICRRPKGRLHSRFKSSSASEIWPRRRPQLFEQTLTGVESPKERCAWFGSVTAPRDAPPACRIEMAERRRRSVKSRCGSSKPPLIGNSDEGGQIGRVATIHC